MVLYVHGWAAYTPDGNDGTMADRKLDEVAVRQAIDAVAAGGAVASYRDFYEALVERLEAEGGRLSRDDERLVRDTLRSAAPLGMTDIDDRMRAAVMERPWYVAAAVFVALCAAGGVIEYFVQLPLDALTGRSGPAPAHAAVGPGYRVALAESTAFRDVLSRVILDDPRLELVTAAVGRPQVEVGVSGQPNGGWRFRLTAVGDGRILEEGPVVGSVADALPPVLQRLVPLEGYVVSCDEDVVWCDLGSDVGVTVGDRLYIVGKGRDVVHPRTGEVLSVEERDVGRATVTKVEARVCRATIAERHEGMRAGVGDRVRVNSSRAAIARPFLQRMVYDVSGDEMLLSIHESFTNETTAPVELGRLAEGIGSKYVPLRVDIGGLQGSPMRHVGDNGRQELYEYRMPRPVAPGETVELVTVGRLGDAVKTVAPGRYRVLLSVGNPPAIDYIFVVNLPPGSRFRSSNVPPSQVVDPVRVGGSRQSAGPVVVVKTAQGPHHRFSLEVEFETATEAEAGRDG